MKYSGAGFTNIRGPSRSAVSSERKGHDALFGASCPVCAARISDHLRLEGVSVNLRTGRNISAGSRKI
jgi:hypothetical protein